MRNAGLNEAQAGIKIAGRNINNLRYPTVIFLDTVIRSEKRHAKKIGPAGRKKEGECCSPLWGEKGQTNNLCQIDGHMVT